MSFMAKTNKASAQIEQLYGANMVVRRGAWGAIEQTVCSRQGIMEDLDIMIHLARAGLKIGFVRDMRAGVSLRRARMSPLTFWRYQRMWPNTYSVHGMRGEAARAWVFAGIGVVLLALVWPVLRAYDPVRRRFSLKYLFSSQEERMIPKI